jgi:hypothetical protein
MANPEGLQWGHKAVSVANQASEGAAIEMVESVESDVKTQRTGYTDGL